MRVKIATIVSVSILLLSAPLTWAQDAQSVVDTHCKACHLAGLGGAPKLDDRAAWAPRLASGIDAMLTTVTSGKGAMPMKGTCTSCTEDQLRAAIELLTQDVR